MVSPAWRFGQVTKTTTNWEDFGVFGIVVVPPEIVGSRGRHLADLHLDGPFLFLPQDDQIQALADVCVGNEPR